MKLSQDPCPNIVVGSNQPKSSVIGCCEWMQWHVDGRHQLVLFFFGWKCGEDTRKMKL